MLMFRHPLCCWNALFPLCTFAKALKGEDPTLIDNTPPPSHPPADTSSDISPLSNHPTSSMRSQGQPGSHPSFARGGREGQQAVSAFNAISLLFIIHVCTPPTHPPCNRPLAPPPSCHHCLIAIFCLPLMIQLSRLFIVAGIRMEKDRLDTNKGRVHHIRAELIPICQSFDLCQSGAKNCAFSSLPLIQDAAQAIKMSERTYCEASAATVAPSFQSLSFSHFYNFQSNSREDGW